MDTIQPQVSASSVPPQGQEKLGSFVSKSYDLYQNMFKSFFQVYWAVFQKYFIIILPALLLQVYAAMQAESKSSTAAIAGLLSLVGTLALVYFFIWVQVAFIQMVRNRNNPQPVEAVLAAAKPQIFGYFTTSLTSGVMTMLWTLLLVIPGIIMGLYYSLAEYVYIDKGLTNMEALKESKRMIEGRWWEVFVAYLVLGLVIIIPIIIGGIILGIFLPKAFEGIGSFALSLFYMPFVAVYGYLIYERLKSLKPEEITVKPEVTV